MDLNEIALALLCSAMLVHFARYWVSITRETLLEGELAKLRAHLDWTAPPRRRQRRKRAAKGRGSSR